MKLHDILTLVRPANIVTAISDILAGMAIAGLGPPIVNAALLIFATTGLYAGGIVFNDIFDVAEDRIDRPERILPRALVSIRAAWILGTLLFLAGITSAFFVSALSGCLALSIAALALLYDKISKHHPVTGPLNMGLCRGLNLLLGMSISFSAVSTHYYMGLIPVLFIAAVTLTAAGEVTGNNRASIGLAIAMDTLVVALFLVLGRYCGISVDHSLPFLALWYIMNGWAKIRAISDNRPQAIRIAVKTGVLSLIVLNAAYVGGFAGWMWALPVILLLPLSLLLAKKFKVT